MNTSLICCTGQTSLVSPVQPLLELGADRGSSIPLSAALSHFPQFYSTTCSSVPLSAALSHSLLWVSAITSLLSHQTFPSHSTQGHTDHPCRTGACSASVGSVEIQLQQHLGALCTFCHPWKVKSPRGAACSSDFPPGALSGTNPPHTQPFVPGTTIAAHSVLSEH